MPLSVVSPVRPTWYALGVKIAGWDIPLPAVIFAAAAAVLVGGLAGESALRRWPLDPVRRKIVRIRRLERKGLTGQKRPVEELLRLARERTVVPLEGRPPVPLHNIPHDTIGDLALDALRRIRTGDPEAPRLFEWSVTSGVSYEEALEAWRAAELAEALQWWESLEAAAAR